MTIIVNGVVADASKAYNQIFETLRYMADTSHGPGAGKRLIKVHESALADIGMSNLEMVFNYQGQELTANISPEFLIASAVEVGDKILASVRFVAEEDTYVIDHATNISRPTCASQPRQL